MPDRVAPLVVQFVSPPIGWSPLLSFLVVWYPSGNTRDPSVIFEAGETPYTGPFHFSHIADYIYYFVLSLTQMWDFLSLYVILSIHTSFHFCRCGRTMSYLTAHLQMSLRAYGKDAFEDTPVFGVRRPACHDSSFYLLVLVLFPDTAVLPQLLSHFYQHIVHVDLGVVYSQYLCEIHLQTHLRKFHRIFFVSTVVILVLFLCISIQYVISKTGIVQKIYVYMQDLVLPVEPSTLFLLLP